MQYRSLISLLTSLSDEALYELYDVAWTFIHIVETHYGERLAHYSAYKTPQHPEPTTIELDDPPF